MEFISARNVEIKDDQVIMKIMCPVDERVLEILSLKPEEVEDDLLVHRIAGYDEYGNPGDSEPFLQLRRQLKKENEVTKDHNHE